MSSTSSVAAAGASAAVRAPSFLRLFTVEVRRFFARRALVVLLALLVIGYVVLVFVVQNHYRRITAQDRANATAERARLIKQSQPSYDQCVKSAAPDNVDEQCGPPLDEQFPVDGFLSVRPMSPAVFTNAATVLGVGTAAIGFLIGATFIGAEWSSRNIVAWLFWEPRRLRLLGAKALALLAVMLAIAALLQLSWAGIGRFLLSHRGSTFPPSPTSDYYSAGEANLLQLRLTLLAVATALLGFGIAQLIRTSAAAFGFGFLYFAVIENAVHALRPRWQPYLLTNNIAAWVQRHGLRLAFDHLDRRTGEYSPQYVHLSNLRGGVIILIYVGVVVAAAVASFRRRDIT